MLKPDCLIHFLTIAVLQTADQSQSIDLQDVESLCGGDLPQLSHGEHPVLSLLHCHLHPLGPEQRLGTLGVLPQHQQHPFQSVSEAPGYSGHVLRLGAPHASDLPHVRRSLASW